MFSPSSCRCRRSAGRMRGAVLAIIVALFTTEYGEERVSRGARMNAIERRKTGHRPSVSAAHGAHEPAVMPLFASPLARSSRAPARARQAHSTTLRRLPCCRKCTRKRRKLGGPWRFHRQGPVDTQESNQTSTPAAPHASDSTGPHRPVPKRPTVVQDQRAPARYRNGPFGAEPRRPTNSGDVARRPRALRLARASW